MMQAYTSGQIIAAEQRMLEFRSRHFWHISAFKQKSSEKPYQQPSRPNRGKVVPKPL